MRTFIVEKNQDGRRVDRWLTKVIPDVSMIQIKQFLRKKCVRLNGKHPKAEDIVQCGDTVQLFIPDEFFERRKKEDSFLKNFRVRIRVLYEDANILLIDKRPGMTVHADDHEKVDTLLNHVRAYLYQKGEYDSMAEDAFSPALCNRIDRFTGGIVIAAKNEAAVKAVDNMIRERMIEKRYLLLAKGRLHPDHGMFDNFILHPEGAKKVQVFDRPTDGAKNARTRYRTLCAGKDVSLVECELLTGRTHQIRAQFAHARHPLLGDGQYGDPFFNQKIGRQGQALYAYGLTFHVCGDAGEFSYLDGLCVHTPDVPFVREFFTDFDLGSITD